jgi:release factor glutamine methyltransferase
MKLRESWVRSMAQLEHAQIADAGIEAEVLIRHALAVERADFFAALNDQLAPPQEARVSRLVERRMAGEPLAYITGRREFYGLDFYVSPGVLIPRQETELLVDRVLEIYVDGSLGAHDGPGHKLAIADVGTGSGAIAIAIAHHLPSATVYATDASREALLVADINRRRHAVERRVHLRQGDLLEALEAPVDAIVSNPPYLRTDELAGLPREVRREPSRALDGGADGLDIVRRLMREAPSHLRPGGRVVVEIAPQQLGPVLRLGRKAFPGASLSFARDMLGLPRMVTIVSPGGRSRTEERRQAADHHSRPHIPDDVPAPVP